MKKRTIHTTNEEILADNSDNTISELVKNTLKLTEIKEAVESLNNTAKDRTEAVLGHTATVERIEDTTNSVKNLEEVLSRKLEEVKSASLVSNRLLKDISKKEIPEPKDFPKEMSVEIKGAELVTIKGEKGEKGEDGLTPTRGELVGLIKPLIPPPIKGEKGKDGESIRGPKGDKGKSGDSIIGPMGPSGPGGKDGSPDTPNEVIGKINASEKIIDAERVRGLVDAIHSIDKFGANPQGYREAGGGGNVIRWLSNGVVVSAYVTEINFSTNITPVYDGNGRITLTATGGGSSSAIESLTPTQSGSNITLDLTGLSHTYIAVTGVFKNGQLLTSTDPTFGWSQVGDTITVLNGFDTDQFQTSYTY